jgi:RNA recognition motif-containing protein
MNVSGSFRRNNQETVKNLFVGNLDFKTTKSDLRALSCLSGSLVVSMFRWTEKGLCTVEMINDDDAKKANCFSRRQGNRRAEREGQ